MNKCPYCEKKAVTVLRKIFLSPGMPATCLSCGKPVGVTYRHWLKAALPGVTVMIIAMFFESSLLMYGLSTVGFALMIWLHLKMVPLVADKSGPKCERVADEGRGKRDDGRRTRGEGR